MRRRKSRTCWASRRSRWRYKNSPKLLKKRVIVANVHAGARFDEDIAAFPMMKDCVGRWSLVVESLASCRALR